MRYVRGQVELPGTNNRPTLDGADIPVSRYTGAIAGGLERMLRLIRVHKEELASPDGPLAAFAKTEIRVILRPTRTYALLWSESIHPFFLGDALERDRFFDQLWLGWRS